MPALRKNAPPTRLIKEWSLTSSATLGSTVRARGILFEVRAHLLPSAKKLLNLEGSALTLRVPEDRCSEFEEVAAIVATTLEGAEGLPVIPREVEDILTISTTERHRWLKDGRLQSAGTRTVKLRGRAQKITFHVFDPRHIEDLLDRDLAAVWREEDAMTAAENRRRAAGRAAVKRAQKKSREAASSPNSSIEDAERHNLDGWDEFICDGFLR